MNQADVFYQAMLARDPRFDGRFFVGVKTTGIYCRPICPAKPKRENVEFFANALSAEKAGYRPCLRCRPESAPQSPAWIGKSTTVQRALKLIASNERFEANEDHFADQLGVSARHLRRLFEDELGRTPKQISDMNRLNFARKLVMETSLPITEIAFTSGFSSIRRFNDAFKERFHRAPSELRKIKTEGSKTSSIQLTLSYRPPFDWDSLLGFYASHQVPGVETVDEVSYNRVFEIEGNIGGLRVTHDPDNSNLKLQVAGVDSKHLFQVAQNVRRMFDLDSDPIYISHIFSHCKTMSKLSEKYQGLRLPRGWDPFETAIGAILGQLVSVSFATQLVGQLVRNYGKMVTNPLSGECAFLFPTARTLSQSTLSHVKTTGARKQAIRLFSRQVVERAVNLSLSQDPDVLRKSLLLIKGVGPWTAEYISLRALGNTDAFPESDLILKRALELNKSIDMNTFRPWRAYGAFYLWKEYAKTLSQKHLRTKRKRP